MHSKTTFLAILGAALAVDSEAFMTSSSRVSFVGRAADVSAATETPAESTEEIPDAPKEESYMAPPPPPVTAAPAAPRKSVFATTGGTAPRLLDPYQSGAKYVKDIAYEDLSDESKYSQLAAEKRTAKNGIADNQFFATMGGTKPRLVDPFQSGAKQIKDISMEDIQDPSRYTELSEAPKPRNGSLKTQYFSTLGGTKPTLLDPNQSGAKVIKDITMEDLN